MSDPSGALDERALLMAVPLRHLEAAVVAGPLARVLLPAGGPGDLDSAGAGTLLLVMATDAGDAEVPAATWSAAVVRRVPYEPGAPWPDGLPATWLAEHAPELPAPTGSADPIAGDDGDDCDGDDWDDWDDDDPEDEDDELGPQAFVEVAGLAPLDRRDWVFANELVRKQARRGRSFRPRVPMLVDLPL